MKPPLNVLFSPLSHKMTLFKKWPSFVRIPRRPYLLFFMFGMQNLNEVISKEFMDFIYKPTFKKNLWGYILNKV